MGLELKFVLPPVLAMGVALGNILTTLPDPVRVALDLAALGVLFAGFLVLGKLRATADAAQAAAEAWRSERDAVSVALEREKAEIQRLREIVSDQRVTISKLEARPTLDTVSTQLDQLKALLVQTAEAVQGVREVDRRGE